MAEGAQVTSISRTGGPPSKATGFGALEFTIGALAVTYTILGVPYCNYTMLQYLFD